MRASEIVKSTVRCPKCKSKTLYLIEEWKGHTIEWEVDNGKFDIHDGNLNPGDAYCVYGKCNKCNHSWKIRKAVQIGDCHE